MHAQEDRMPSATNTAKRDRAETRRALVGGYLALSAITSICAAVALRDRGGPARWFFGPFWLTLAIGVLLLARMDRLGANAFLVAAWLVVASIVSFVLGGAGLDMLLFFTALILAGHSLWRRHGLRSRGR